jgi:UDP-glucose 4-epimerase
LRIVVAGASGYLGAWITEFLGRAGHEVIALLEQPLTDPCGWGLRNVTMIVGDIRKAKTITELVELQADCVIYTISLNHTVSEQDIDTTMGVNVAPMWKLLEACSKKSLPRFIYLSTQQVYGVLNPGVVDERCFKAPRNVYGLTHLMCEQVGQLFQRRTDTTCVNLRLSNGYGVPRFADTDCWWLVINDLCRMAYRCHEIRLLSDGSPLRDFIHIDDIFQAVELLAMLPKHAITEVDYNLGSGKTYTILELAQIIAGFCTEEYGIDVPVLLPDGKMSQSIAERSDTKKWTYNHERLGALGFSPNISLRNGISSIFRYLNSPNE